MKYRIAQIDDLNAILEMILPIKAHFVASGSDIWDGDYPSKEIIQADIAGGSGRVLESEGEVIAYLAFLDAEEYDLELVKQNNLLGFGRVMVKREFQGRGISKLLIADTLQEIKELKYSGACLLVDDSNIKAVNLYKQFGFMKISQEQFPWGILDFYMLLFL